MFDSRDSSIDCQSDNIVVYNEKKFKVFDYCEKKNDKSFLGVKHISHSLYVLYVYGSGLNFTVSFDWLALDTINSITESLSQSSLNSPTNIYKTSVTIPNTTTAPKTTTLPKTTKQPTTFVDSTTTFESTPVTTTLAISNKPAIIVNFESTNVHSSSVFSSTSSENLDFNTTTEIAKPTTTTLTTLTTQSTKKPTTSTAVTPSLESKFI
jgi:hypothetical protein